MHDEEDRAATLRRHRAEQGQRKGTIAAVVVFTVTTLVVGWGMFALNGFDELTLGVTVVSAGAAARAVFFRYAGRLGGGLDASALDDEDGFWSGADDLRDL